MDHTVSPGPRGPRSGLNPGSACDAPHASDWNSRDRAACYCRNFLAQVFVARNGRQEFTSTIFIEEQVEHLVKQMLKSSGRRLDLLRPFVDAWLRGLSAGTSSSRTSFGATWL